MKIKPHHFLDIIKLHGVGYETFVPDSSHHHDFYRVGNLILSQPQAELQLVLTGDDICKPCLSYQDGHCQDMLSELSKEEYNLRLDQRMFDIFHLQPNRIYTALELCLTLDVNSEKIREVWLEEPEQALQQRIKNFKIGAAKYIERYTVKREENIDFRHGVIDAFCEIVRAGVKKLAFSHATNCMDYFKADLEHAYYCCQKYHVKMYIENDLVETCLFKNSGSHVIIFYSNEKDIQDYLTLKNKKQESKEEKIAAAMELGRLLSYQQDRIQQMIQENI